MKVPASVLHRHPSPLVACLIATIGLSVSTLSAQTTIKPRGERLPQAPKLRTLTVRESTLTSAVAKASAVYRKEATSSAYLLESSEGTTTLVWKIGEKEHPLPEGMKAPARASERRVKLIPHEEKLFLKIDTLTRPDPDQGGKEVRFSGTYEATVLEGSWAGHQEGAALKVRLAPGDHDRYLADLRKAHFDEATLARHATHYREQLIGLLEGKLSDPGAAPASELEMVRALVTLVKAHPETFVVIVTPEFQSAPEIFTLEGDTMRSTTESQSTTLRFDAKLPALAPARP